MQDFLFSFDDFPPEVQKMNPHYNGKRWRSCSTFFCEMFGNEQFWCISPSEGSEIWVDSLILLMVQKSQNNHLGCIKNPVHNWDKLASSTGEFTGFLNHQQYVWIHIWNMSICLGWNPGAFCPMLNHWKVELYDGAWRANPTGCVALNEETTGAGESGR